MCFVCISEQTAIIYIYSIDSLVCVNETENVFCAVRTGSLNKSDGVSSLKCKRGIEISFLLQKRHRSTC